MKKTVILAAAAAMALAGCAKVDTVPTSTPANQKDLAMDFGVYVAQTKAGSAGEMDQTKLQTTGFGVFAFEEAGGYSKSIKPNFMYNQEVTFNSTATKWEYHPVKYWPNQLTDDGTTDGNGASSATAHKVTFFAYAPYVASAEGTEGITAMSAKSLAGDPTLTYVVSEDLDKNVDLVWGTSNGAAWNNVAGGTNTCAEGLPYIDLQKPAIGTKVHFKFYHALAQLNLTAQMSYNIIGAGGTAADGVKITIKEVELTVPDMYRQGVLNLNNITAKQPLWSFDGQTPASLSLVVNDDKLHTDVKDAGPAEAADQPAGVIATEGPVVATGKYFTLLPREKADGEGGIDVTVKVTYYVTTDDANLDDGYSRVENVISKTINFPRGFKAGTKNNIKMILGISEVALSGEVEEWETGTDLVDYWPKNKE